MAAQTKLTQVKNGQVVADTRDHPDPRPAHDTADTIAEQAHTAADMATQRVQDPMALLVRQGLDTSLRSLQAWADLARQLGATTPGSLTATTMVSLAYDVFEALLAAQREVVNELVDGQRQFAQRFFDTAAATGDDLTCR